MQEGTEAISKNESINLEGDNTLNIINSESVNRKLAFEIARKAEQILKGSPVYGFESAELHSEDIY